MSTLGIGQYDIMFLLILQMFISIFIGYNFVSDKVDIVLESERP